MVACRTTATDDLINLVFIGFAEGRLLAHENRLAEAEAVGRDAVEFADRSDFCFARPLAPRHHGARDPGGDVMLAARVRERLAAVGVRVAEQVA